MQNDPVEEIIPEDTSEIDVDPVETEPIPEEEIPEEEIPEDTPEEEIPEEEVPDKTPGYNLYEEDDWQVEITVIAKNRNDVTPYSGVISENRVTVNNVITDSQLLAILNFIAPKPTI